jgi:hypothetical protein
MTSREIDPQGLSCNAKCWRLTGKTKDESGMKSLNNLIFFIKIEKRSIWIERKRGENT